jgi:hypothetical protein
MLGSFVQKTVEGRTPIEIGRDLNGRQAPPVASSQGRLSGLSSRQGMKAHTFSRRAECLRVPDGRKINISNMYGKVKLQPVTRVALFLTGTPAHAPSTG